VFTACQTELHRLDYDRAVTSRPMPLRAPPIDRSGPKRALYLPSEHVRKKILKGDILTNIRTLTEKASELGTGAKESMDELGRSAGRKLDEAREETGDALHSAASSVRATGRRGSEAIDNLATGTADRLDATASYVEDHDLKGVFADLRKFGRRHLTGSLVAAAAIGFLVGSTFSGAPQSRKRR